jgi:hypothetical protein|tara:strand:+ start:414 stop:3221 length:2808 start_codon:yes stop_codon:yes gene_type:complete
MSLSNAPTSPNVNENYLFQFTADNNTCLEFDGTDDKVTYGNILATYIDFTVEFWVKADSVSGTDYPIFHRSGGSSEDLEDNNSLVISLDGPEIQVFYEYGSGANVDLQTGTSGFDSLGLSANTWTHIAAVRSSVTDDIRIYKNGTLVSTMSSTASANDPSGGDSSDMRVNIGTNYANSKFFDGELAHLRVWSMARDASQIARYYQRSIDSSASNLVGYWKFDEGTGTSALDSSTNSNSGTISGASYNIKGFDKFIHSFGLAFGHTTLDSNQYYGSIVNKNIVLRESIDITQGTASTSNMSVVSSNFIFENVDFYKHVFNYSEKNYHNKEVRVYAQFNNASSSSNCQRIFTGRLVDVKLNQNQQVTFKINAHRPWDGISFPQTQHSKYNIYEPIVYGAFNPSITQSPLVASYGGLFPCPVLTVSRHTITTLMPKSYSASDNSHIHYYGGQDYFFRLQQSASNTTITEATSTEYGVNILETPATYVARGNFVPKVSSYTTSAVTFLNNTQNVFDIASDGGIDTSTSATSSITSVGDTRFLQCQTLPRVFDRTTIRSCRITMSGIISGGGVDQAYDISFFSNNNADNILTDNNRVIGQSSSGNVTAFGFDTAPSNAINSVTGVACPDELLIKWVHDSFSPNIHADHTLTVFGVTLNPAIEFDTDEDDLKRLSDLKYFYSGGAGLTASWDSDAIVYGHDAHRDLLQRFAGISSDDPTNWSALNTDRTVDGWKIRYWQLEPTSLKDNLDKLAYEFGFVQKFDAENNVKYIYVKQSSELNAVLNLSKNDVKNISISTTGLNSVITQMDINNNLHPAENNKYYSSSSVVNDNRFKYNLGEKEGIKNINLDYNIGAIPTSANSDPNTDFYSYYDNLIGDMKVLVQCEVVNLAKGYQLETGDIITFTDMPVEMFGTNFTTSTKFMIVETKRSPGQIIITAREVG